MNKFWELYEKNAVISGVLAVILVGGCVAMGLMGRVERAAEQPDAHAGRCHGKFEMGWLVFAQGRVWPVPRTTYFDVVSCSSPTGPRA